MYTFDEEWLRCRLRALDKPRRLAFAVACAERTFGPYRYYARQAHRGRPRFLRATLNNLWELAVQRHIGHREPFLDEGERLIPLSCMQADPEVEEACLYKEAHDLDIVADEAVYTLLAACQCELDGDVQSSVVAAQHDYDLVTSSILYFDTRAKRRIYRACARRRGRAPREIDLVNQIDYVQEELQQQMLDLQELTEWEGAGKYAELVSGLRRRAQRRARALQVILRSLTSEV